MFPTNLSFIEFRKEIYPTYFKTNSLPNICVDVNLFRLITSFLAISITFLIILPGFRGKKFSVLLRWGTSLIILFLILFCNLMPYWEYGRLQSIMPYRFGRSQQINATIGLNIGLRGINVTLIGDPINQQNETIDYNEYFDWQWSQGRPGFGYDAGTFQKNYRHAQFRGLPYPILWVAETFTIDYESIHFGRYYRQAGWLAHIFLWTAIPLFILSNILFQMVIYYGSLFIIFTGISLLTANAVYIIYVQNNNSIQFRLAFDNGFLITHFSWCFYINLINGIVCILIGILTLIADLRLPDETADFFGNDVLQSYEDYFADPQDLNNGTKGVMKNANNELIQIENSDNEVLLRRKKQNSSDNSKTSSGEITRGLKRRTLSNRFSRFQKSTLRSVKKINVTTNDDDNKQPIDNSTSSIKPNIDAHYPVPQQHPQYHQPHHQQQQQPQHHQPPQVEMPLYENFRQFATIGEDKEEEI